MAKTTGKHKISFRFTGQVLMTGFLFAAVAYRAIPHKYMTGVEFSLIWLVCLLLGAFATPRSAWGAQSLPGILLIPLSLDYLLNCQEEFVAPAVGLCVLGVCGYMAVIVVLCFRDRRKRNWRRFACHQLFRCRTIISVILTAALILGGVWNLVETKREQEKPDVARMEQLLQTMNNDRALLSSLQQSCWEAMTGQERLDTLERVLDLECDYLGLPYQLTLREMQSDTLWGSYSHSRRTVSINETLLEDGNRKQALSTLFHEVYHSVEHAMAQVFEQSDETLLQLQMFDSARVYSREFADYISSEEDYQAYRAQLVESDSRAYSEQRLRDYLEVLDYLSRR